MKHKYSTLRLILGDQLNINHSWYQEADPSVIYTLMEVRTETDYVWHHIQKVCAFFAAMEEFAAKLTEMGHAVHYIKLDDPKNAQSFEGNCNAIIAQYNIDHFQYQLPDEYRVDEALKLYCNTLTIKTASFDTEHFFTKRNDVSDFFSQDKPVLMENFYRHMRSRYNILMSGTAPIGGQRNFDHDNRKKLPKNHKPFPAILFQNNVAAQYARITAAQIKTIGTVIPSDFQWPLNRGQSLELLNHFISYCLPLFGTFQDAMHTDEWYLYHSRLSFSLNTKMLSPQEVVQAAVESFNLRVSEINQVEGFVRQVLGWREYMRGIYWMKMPGFETLNFFNHKNNLPAWYWTGNTKMNCLKHAINQSLNGAYAHHIQRLMITGNFALLTGTAPDHVDFWYLGIYIDAIQWVEITNTRGMSQFADGGITGSKPYAASANYINKMSNYCDGCSYDKSQRTTANACPFNSLYWDFHERHRKKLENHPRLKMVYALWDKMPFTEQGAIIQRAAYCISNVENL